MSEQEILRWLAIAEQQMGQGQLEGAIESLRRVLSLDPDLADAHALLALCLAEKKRLHAAQHESGLALALEPESSLALYASGVILTLQRKFKEAEERLRRLLEQEPTHVGGFRALADLYGLTGRREEQRELLEKALEIDPESPDTLVDLGEWSLAQGDADGAEKRAREALEILPEHHRALVLMGNVLLFRGRIDEARDHAIWALRNDPASRGALHLMASVKARRSFWLGLWWRYSAWMGALGDGRAILVLLAAYVLYSVGVITAETNDQQRLAEYLSFFWLAIVAYTWVGPMLFRRSLEKELATVQLDDEF